MFRMSKTCILISFMKASFEIQYKLRWLILVGTGLGLLFFCIIFDVSGAWIRVLWGFVEKVLMVLWIPCCSAAVLAKPYPSPYSCVAKIYKSLWTVCRLLWQIHHFTESILNKRENLWKPSAFMGVHEHCHGSSQLSLVSGNEDELKRSEVAQDANFSCALQGLFMLAQAVHPSKPKELHFVTLVLSAGRWRK